MNIKSIKLTDDLYRYLLSVSLRDTPLQKSLREETEKSEWAIMQISPEQAQFMAMLISLCGAKKILEIGVFTGYSALAVAQALPEDGKLIACDISAEWTDIAKRFWQQAHVDHKIDLRLAPAIETLDDLLNQGNENNFDFAFIDADKQNQLAYYERCLKLIKTGGLIVVDNVLWGGSVVDSNDQTKDTVAIRNFNDFVFADKRVDISLIPVGDGLTLARKK